MSRPSIPPGPTSPLSDLPAGVAPPAPPRPRAGHTPRRGEAKVEQARGRAAEGDESAFDLARRHLAAEQLPGRDDPLAAQRRVVHPGLAVAGGGHHHVADADFRDARVGRGRHADQVVGRALAHAQHLGDQGGQDPVAHAQHQRHAPHHAVVVGHEGQRADGAGVLAQHGQRRHHAAEAVQVGQGRVAHGHGAGHRHVGRQAAVAAAFERKTQHHAALAQLPGQHRVVVGQTGQQLAHTGRHRPVGADRGRRGAVGFGEHDVEADGRRLVGLQPRHQLGDAVAWPGPLAELGQAVLVDVDDAHGGVLVHPGLQPLVLVPQGMTQRTHQRRVGQQHGRHQRHGQQGCQHVQVSDLAQDFSHRDGACRLSAGLRHAGMPTPPANIK